MVGFTSLKNTMQTLLQRSKILFLSATLLTSFLITQNAFAQVEPGERCFTITGYYSALPPGEQRVYSNGGTDHDAHQRELVLNGQGKTMANGQAPYLGAVAAPSTYPFGTQIRLDGIGIFKVFLRTS